MKMAVLLFVIAYLHTLQYIREIDKTRNHSIVLKVGLATAMAWAVWSLVALASSVALVADGRRAVRGWFGSEIVRVEVSPVMYSITVLP